jgi:hypothetical protein
MAENGGFEPQSGLLLAAETEEIPQNYAEVASRVIAVNYRDLIRFARRDRWFLDEGHRNGIIRCALCLGAGSHRSLELHHLAYRGVGQTLHGWTAHERHEDLTALHPRCHEYVHQLIERDRAFSGFVSRRTASIQAIAGLQANIAH